MKPLCPASVRFDDFDLGDLPVEQIVGALSFQSLHGRGVDRVGHHGVDELVQRDEGAVHLAGQAVVEGVQLVVIQSCRQWNF